MASAIAIDHSALPKAVLGSSPASAPSMLAAHTAQMAAMAPLEAELTILPSLGESPDEREGATLTTLLDNRSAVLFGGYSMLASVDFNDAWLLDVSQDDPCWSEIDVVRPGHCHEGPHVDTHTHRLPIPRSGHTAVCTDHGNLCVFGGFSKAEKTFLNDVHELDLRTRRWHALRVAGRSGSLPRGRRGHSAVWVDGRLLVFGGLTLAGASNELLCLERSRSKSHDFDKDAVDAPQAWWRTIEAAARPSPGLWPPPLFDHQCCYFEHSGLVYVVGGVAGSAAAAGASTGGDGMWVYDWEAGTWACVATGGGHFKRARHRVCAVFPDTVVSVGGCKRASPNDYSHPAVQVFNVDTERVHEVGVQQQGVNDWRVCIGDDPTVELRDVATRRDFCMAAVMLGRSETQSVVFWSGRCPRGYCSLALWCLLLDDTTAAASSPSSPYLARKLSSDDDDYDEGSPVPMGFGALPPGSGSGSGSALVHMDARALLAASARVYPQQHHSEDVCGSDTYDPTALLLHHDDAIDYGKDDTGGSATDARGQRSGDTVVVHDSAISSLDSQHNGSSHPAGGVGIGSLLNAARERSGSEVIHFDLNLGDIDGGGGGGSGANNDGNGNGNDNDNDNDGGSESSELSEHHGQHGLYSMPHASAIGADTDAAEGPLASPAQRGTGQGTSNRNLDFPLAPPPQQQKQQQCEDLLSASHYISLADAVPEGAYATYPTTHVYPVSPTPGAGPAADSTFPLEDTASSFVTSNPLHSRSLVDLGDGGASGSSNATSAAAVGADWLVRRHTMPSVTSTDDGGDDGNTVHSPPRRAATESSATGTENSVQVAARRAAQQAMRAEETSGAAAVESAAAPKHSSTSATIEAAAPLRAGTSTSTLADASILSFGGGSGSTAGHHSALVPGQLRPGSATPTDARSLSGADATTAPATPVPPAHPPTAHQSVQQTPLGQTAAPVHVPVEQAAAAHAGASTSTGTGTSKTSAVHRLNHEVWASQGIESWSRGKLLGNGAYGDVYCCLDHLTGEFFATKEVRVSNTMSERAIEGLSKEVMLLRSLTHPNIVQFVGCECDEGILYIQMQYCSGGDLRGVIKAFGGLPGTVAAKYTKQILGGLCYLHNNHVIHRDLKGANVLLTAEGVCKLSDFGLAKVESSMGAEGLRTVAGTPYWMAPEVVMGNGAVQGSDVWSLGCTVFEMANIKPPFASLEPTAALFHIGAQGTLIDEIPESLGEQGQDFVLKCMAKAVAERPSCSELKHHPFLA